MVSDKLVKIPLLKFEMFAVEFAFTSILVPIQTRAVGAREKSIALPEVKVLFVCGIESHLSVFMILPELVRLYGENLVLEA